VFLPRASASGASDSIAIGASASDSISIGASASDSISIGASDLIDPIGSTATSETGTGSRAP
jgi:hypothetical protein